MIVNCANCNKSLFRQRCRALKGNCYCNTICQNEYEYRNGIKTKKITLKANMKLRELGLKKYLENPTIKLGKRGYKVIYVPKSSGEIKTGWRYYHHWIWEKETKRIIEKGFCIHHKDGNPLNNNIENLVYMSIKEHNLIKRNYRKRTSKKA